LQEKTHTFISVQGYVTLPSRHAKTLTSTSALLQFVASC